MSREFKWYTKKFPNMSTGPVNHGVIKNCLTTLNVLDLKCELERVFGQSKLIPDKKVAAIQRDFQKLFMKMMKIPVLPKIWNMPDWETYLRSVLGNKWASIEAKEACSDGSWIIQDYSAAGGIAFYQVCLTKDTC
jgi:hypothetical protein